MIRAYLLDFLGALSIFATGYGLLWIATALGN